MSAAGKFLFSGLMLSGDYNRDSDGKITAIQNAQIRLLLQSSAPFPISFVVDELQTSFENTYAPNKPRDSNGGLIVANNQLQNVQ